MNDVTAEAKPAESCTFTGQPQRVHLSRKRGWRMPENTVKVDRSTKWGNPFIVGKHGTRTGCARLFEAMLSGLLCMDADNVEEQDAYLKMARRHIKQLRGKNLACWCPAGSACHADVLLRLANAELTAEVVAP